MNVLLTGGTGYIGSHTAIVLAVSGHQITLYDNLSNSSESVIEKMTQITGQQFRFIRGDVRDTDLLSHTLDSCGIDTVVHFAGLKAVGESVEKPIDYYANNVQGAISLLQAMKSVHVKTLVFSSSATVYGEPQYLPLDESHAAALGFLSKTAGWYAINLGTGKGYSVLDMVQAFEKVSGQKITYGISARRQGDVATSYANPAKAQKTLGWSAKRSLYAMCSSAFKFQQEN